MIISDILQYPLGLLMKAAVVRMFGSTRQKEQFDLLRRAPYAYGLFRAADVAKVAGKKRTTVCEFGVADGTGLLNMIHLSEKISKETGIKFDIIGFDSGEGLLEVNGYKDHPELWTVGDFKTENKDELLKKIGNKAQLFIGDIKDTVYDFMDILKPESPIGFISVDVDVYTASKEALKCLTGDSELYNPAVSIYFDDVKSFFSNKWCGELASIEEFNIENSLRKIDFDRSIEMRPTYHYLRRTWSDQMYTCHILDHANRVRCSEREPNNMDTYADDGNPNRKYRLD